MPKFKLQNERVRRRGTQYTRWMKSALEWSNSRIGSVWNDVPSALPFTHQLSFQVFVSEVNNVQLEEKISVKQRQIWEWAVGHLPHEGALKRQTSQPPSQADLQNLSVAIPSARVGRSACKTPESYVTQTKVGGKWMARRAQCFSTADQKPPKSHFKCGWAIHRQRWGGAKGRVF